MDKEEERKLIYKALSLRKNNIEMAHNLDKKQEAEWFERHGKEHLDLEHLMKKFK